MLPVECKEWVTRFWQTFECISSTRLCQQYILESTHALPDVYCPSPKHFNLEMGTGSMSDRIGGTVTIDMGYYPGDFNVKVDTKGGYDYDSLTGRIVNLKAEDYPKKYGPYLKFTHTSEGAGIKSILHKGKPQNVLSGNLSKWRSVTVYYWSSNYQNPLLIQLGSGNEYYKHTGTGDTWSKENINEDDLKQKLDEQNCEKNKAHILKISENTNNGYQCPSCASQWIAVSYIPQPQYKYMRRRHYISSANTSITRFKDNENDQVGLPSIKHRLYQCLQLSKRWRNIPSNLL